MCGITALYSFIHSKNLDEKQQYIDKCNKSVEIGTSKIRHRGPDWSGIYNNLTHFNKWVSDIVPYVVMAHERLEIIDPANGAQPLIHHIDNDPLKEIVLCVNGEIYNHKDLREKYKDHFKFKTNSDCEVIIPLYLDYFNKCQSGFDTEKCAIEMMDALDGMFSFTIYNSVNHEFFISRDPIGITSLYYGVQNQDNNIFNLYISSEMKALSDCDDVIQFPAGHFMTSQLEHFKPIEYFSKTFTGNWTNGNVPTENLDLAYTLDMIRTHFTNAVRKRLMTDVPFGILLSGGLDSSLVASIAVKIIREEGLEMPWGKEIHTFSIGLEGSPDLHYAEKVAKFLGTKHHTFTMSVQEGIDAVDKVVEHIETYDITTIRASTPMYLLSRKIKAMGVKMVLSGEGSDEMFGGYLYFNDAPSKDEFHRECVSRMRNLQYSDCQRANKSTMAWGVEGRFPFLDKEFLNFVMTMNPALKSTNKIEKWILREAFNTKNDDGSNIYLPDEVLWRQKEQFSDGVGYNWIDTLIEHCNKKYNKTDIKYASIKYLVNPPISGEALYYREVYEKLFPNRENAVKLWIPRTDWGCSADPSGRVQKSHNSFQHTLEK